MERELAAYRDKKRNQLCGKPVITSEKTSTELNSNSDSLDNLIGVSESGSSSSGERIYSHLDSQTIIGKYDVYLYWISVLLKCLLWCSLMTLAVKLEFGSVFFILTLFYLIAVNLRTRPKRQGELSAYSVFNPNFEKLDGTLTAEQFERELVFGAAAVH